MLPSAQPSPVHGEAEPLARSGGALTARSVLAALGLFILLAVVHTWPLASAPGTLSRNDNGDTLLHEWILAWDAHQIVNDPRHLFDANIFYPERNTLAYSDPLLLHAAIAAPLLWAGGSPVLAFNLVLLAGFALTGWAMALVVARWTGSWTAGILSGCLVAFNSFTMTRLPQIQDQHLEFFPLMLLALDRLIAAPRARYALQTAGWYVLQALTGQYLLVFTAIAAVAATLSRAGEWIGPRFKAFAANAALAVVLAALVVVPLLVPYMWVSRTAGLSRSLEDTALYSAHLDSYLAGAGRMYLAMRRVPFIGEWLFPGTIALALAALAVASGTAFKDRRARMALTFGLVSFGLSFGAAFPPYRWLYRVFPLMAGIRGASRFGQFAIAGVAILAGFGLARLKSSLSSRVGAAVAILLVVGANIEALRAPFDGTASPAFRVYAGIPPIYDELTKAGPHAVMAAFPFFNSAEFHGNAPLMLNSTRSWVPMLNGYSGFKPPSFYQHVQALGAFPDERSLSYLREQGVTHVLVNVHDMRPERLEQLGSFPELKLWLDDGNVRVYFLAHEG